MSSLKIDPEHQLYDAVIGVGGIGAGSFFLLDSNHTIGREESRGGHFLEKRDYCKLHIVTHYIQTLLGSQISVFPVGKVGADDWGRNLLGELERAGMSLAYIAESPQDRTLFSFCFVYPDGDVGNLTTSDSACSKVDAAFVDEAVAEFVHFQGRGIALAVPEVPLRARQRLLELGTAYDFFRVASFTAEEAAAVLESSLLNQVDLLAVNLLEAAALAQKSIEEDEPLDILETAFQRLRSTNPKIQVCVTYGKKGSWSWDGCRLNHEPVWDVDVESTAGAGDAFLAGVITGLTAGLSLRGAQQLGTLTGSYSVTSPHTIHPEMDRNSLSALLRRSKRAVSEEVARLLEG